MYQIMIVNGNDAQDLTNKVNAFLATIESESVKGVEVKGDYAVIHYETVEAWKKAFCFDCACWDDGGAPDALSGLCHEHGGRRRFNCKACKNFKDIRG